MLHPGSPIKLRLGGATATSTRAFKSITLQRTRPIVPRSTQSNRIHPHCENASENSGSHTQIQSSPAASALHPPASAPRNLENSVWILFSINPYCPASMPNLYTTPASFVGPHTRCACTSEAHKCTGQHGAGLRHQHSSPLLNINLKSDALEANRRALGPHAHLLHAIFRYSGKSSMYNLLASGIYKGSLIICSREKHSLLHTIYLLAE